MPIHNTSLEKFQKLYQQERGKYLSEEDAIEMVTRLISLYQILYRPLSAEYNDATMRPSEDPPDLHLNASFPNPE